MNTLPIAMRTMKRGLFKVVLCLAMLLAIVAGCTEEENPCRRNLAYNFSVYEACGVDGGHWDPAAYRYECTETDERFTECTLGCAEATSCEGLSENNFSHQAYVACVNYCVNFFDKFVQ